MCKGNGTIQFLKGTKTMKKIFAIALAVVMVLSIASVASAFTWSKPADSTTADNFGYSIDVIKFTRSTGELGSSYFKADDAATAVNGADVYWAIKLVVPDLAADNKVRQNAKVSVSITALDGVKDMPATSLANSSAGIYYYGTMDGVNYAFYSIKDFKQNALGMNHTAETPVFAARCLDTATAKVSAKVTSKPDLSRPWSASSGSYDVYVDGNFKRTIDCYFDYAGQEHRGINIFHVLNLPQGKHTVKLVVKGEKRPESAGCKVAITGAVVYKTADKNNVNYKFSFQ